MAVLVAPFISTLINLLVHYAKEETVLLLGVSGEIKKLIRKLSMIQKVVEDAERKQVNDQSIRLWLDDLKDVIYDAQDIIDDYKFEVEKHNAASSSTSESTKVNCCYSPFICFGKARFNHEIGNRIKDLVIRLDELNKDTGPLNLICTSIDHRIGPIGNGISRFTSPIVEPDIVGTAVEEDTRHLVEFLTKENNSTNIVICAIIGMAGVGKTTLAQKIYNDDTLQANFQSIKPIWVCISKDSIDEIKILKSIVKGAGGDPSNIDDRVELERLLFEIVRQKRFFLVLDDVWDVKVWEGLLRKPLHGANSGSRVLVTTRDEGIAKQMGATFCHKVSELSDEDGWSLLCKIVFRDGQGQEKHTLTELGKQIVKKCNGLPLAIRTIAGVLQRREPRRSEWEKVLRNPTWSFPELPNDVTTALNLSYEDLHPHLKQCFIYFSLFPEDYELYRGDITSLWIAEGFVEVKENSMLEETANEYWNELIQRNLLQVYDHANFKCKMHDLLRTLAQRLARYECWCGDIRGLNEIVSKSHKKARRWFMHGVSEFSLHELEELTSLRTLIARRLFGQLSDDDFIIPKHIRILNISGSTIERLPCSFGNLIYLRYLNLSHTLIREIPDNIKCLRNLQFLCLFGCKNLQSIPKAIGFLTNMRHLIVAKTLVDKIPKEMVRLVELRTLNGYVLSGSKDEIDHREHNGRECCTMEDLSEFRHLRCLTLYNLERASGGTEARKASLRDKSHLTQLLLACNHPEAYNEEMAKRITQVFEELCPPSCIEELFVEGYFGQIFPHWLMKSPAFPNLRRLVLMDCPLCEELPPLGLLHHLAWLYVSDMPRLKRIGRELFLPANNFLESRHRQDTLFRSLPNLEYVLFDHLSAWEEWLWLDEKEDRNQQIVLLPSLQQLLLDSCSKLTFLPNRLLNRATALRDLQIIKAQKLEAIDNLDYIKRLWIEDCPSLKRVANLSSLKFLNAIQCKNSMVVEHLPDLHILDLQDLGMKSIPEWLDSSSTGLSFPKLHKLWIKGSQDLVFKCVLDGPYWSNIRDISQFRASSTDTYAFISYTKRPFFFETNIRLDSHTMEEMSKTRPKQVDSSFHEHVLLLMRRINFRCDKCGEEVSGSFWSYYCKECAFDLCLQCALEGNDEGGLVKGEENETAQSMGEVTIHADLQEQQVGVAITGTTSSTWGALAQELKRAAKGLVSMEGPARA